LTVTTGKIYDSKNSELPADAIYSISVDSKNILWIGTSYKGLVKFDRKNFIVYNKSISILPVNKVTSVYVDKHDRIWAGTPEETVVIDNDKWMTAAELDRSNYDTGIYQINGDRLGRILFAYKFGGFGIYDGKKYSSYTLENSQIPIKGFYSVTADSNNIIWLGSFEQGVVKFNGKDWDWLNKSNSELKDDLVFYVFTDANNNKWFCTYFAVLFVYNEDGIKLK